MGAHGFLCSMEKRDAKKIDHRPVYVLAVVYLIGSFLFLLGYCYR